MDCGSIHDILLRFRYNVMKTHLLHKQNFSMPSLQAKIFVPEFAESKSAEQRELSISSFSSLAKIAVSSKSNNWCLPKSFVTL